MKKETTKKVKKPSFIEKVGSKIPDPVLIFIGLYVIVMVITGIFGGTVF